MDDLPVEFDLLELEEARRCVKDAESELNGDMDQLQEKVDSMELNGKDEKMDDQTVVLNSEIVSIDKSEITDKTESSRVDQSLDVVAALIASPDDYILFIYGQTNCKVNKLRFLKNSYFFERRYIEGTWDGNPNYIIINDLKEELVTQLIGYVITGSMQNIYGLAEDYLNAADNYCFTDLRRKVTDHIISSADSSNVIHYLKVAYKTKSQYLKTKLLQVAADNYVKIARDYNELRGTYPKIYTDIFFTMVQFPENL